MTEYRYNKSLYRMVKDAAGEQEEGCFTKCYLMACLARLLELKNYVEIGARDKGVLTAVAASFVLHGGTAESGLRGRDKRDKIDMLHVNGEAGQDYEDSCALLADSAVLVFSGGGALEQKEKAKAAHALIYEGDGYVILLKGAAGTISARKLGAELAGAARKIGESGGRPVVSVGVLAYNHENFIAECLENIFNQRGYFSLKVRICEDCSDDGTVKAIESALAKIDPCAAIDAELIQNPRNIGMVQNFKQLAYMMGGGDYFTFCEGDDYYCDKNRIQAHIDYLEANPLLAFSFNALMFLHEDTGKFENYLKHEELSGKSVFYTADLAKINFIGNLGAGFYRAWHLKNLNPEIFERTYCGDWMFNIEYSERGKFGYIPKRMNVYRKHKGGIWSGMDYAEMCSKSLEYINSYNKFTGYRYDYEFQQIQDTVMGEINKVNPFSPAVSKDTVKDIMMYDDAFPHPHSGFRLQEYTSLLEAFEHSQLIFPAWLHPALGGDKKEIMREYKRANPDIAHKISLTPPVIDSTDAPAFLRNSSAKLFYTVFLRNIRWILGHLERAHIPFAFTLYPGGEFLMGSSESDGILKRVLSSDYFRGVIVTQQNVYDYLLEKGFCKKEDMHFIFGVVTPLENLTAGARKNFLADKLTIDICFIAHKYSEYGKDKGYDTFIRAAKILSGLHDNIRFHVVGGFDEKVIDVAEIAGRIVFYGARPQEWLRGFFAGVDIAVSPNIPHVLTPGVFDGFPTAACTDAALSKVAVFCTDELSLNQGRFTDGEEIVIIKPDADYIAGCIDYYIKRPELLRQISEAGCRRARELYNYDAQIAPRIKILREILEPHRFLTENAKKSANAKPMEIIPVMHCFDNNYAIPAAVSFYSMLRHANPAYGYKLYVLHSDVTHRNQQKLTELVEGFPNASLEFIDMSHRFNDVWKAIYRNNVTHITKECLYKLIAPSVFPQHDKIIITDVDVVFEGDISPSFSSVDPDGVYMAGVKHIYPRGSFLEDFYPSYLQHFGKNALERLEICAGFLVLNLKRLREDKMEQVFLRYLKRHARHFLQVEQDVINFCLKSESIAKLPLNYVVCSYAYELFPDEASYAADRHYAPGQIEGALKNPVQLHYAKKDKPWNSPGSTKAGKWFATLRQTDFYTDYARMSAHESKAPEGGQIRPGDIWGGYSEPDFPVMVSVVCCTYNHERFIRKTLGYIAGQKTDYTFEVIVADDASSDGTQEIIKEYAGRYPGLFKKCILRRENAGIGQNYYDALKLAEGKYLALCDGDDYWVSPHKLQWQAGFLEQNPGFSVCCSSFVSRRADYNSEGVGRVFDVNEYIKASWRLRGSEGYGFEDLLYCRFVASCTVMMRWRLHGRVPEFLKRSYVVDFPLTLIHAAFGRIHVINRPALAQYNRSKQGVFSKKRQSFVSETLKIVREVNQYLDFRFAKTVSEYLSAAGAKVQPNLKRKERLKWFYINCVPPFVQRIYVKTKTKRQQRRQTLAKRAEPGYTSDGSDLSRWEVFLWVAYNEYTPEIAKKIYRKLKKLFKRK